ncbi:beta-ketoacyl reductase, partial [Streptomyces sp. NPDC058045]|uniref:beta-ketoacyl reductase n=1 Tax=Streptomyces sp. NPDC058045 TaxID=3346311 RepID=UPI0036E284D5
EGLRAEGCVVRSVFHTAGVPGRFVPVAETTVGDMEEVFAGKVGAAVVLDELFAGQDLDAFVLYSSIAGVLSGVGQGAYAAANAFLDALAERRRARGDKATSIAWGMWSGEGFAGEQGVEEAMRLMGMEWMDPQQALLGLQQALDRDETTVSIAAMDWERFASRFTADRPSPLLSELKELERPDQDQRAASGDSRSELAQRLAAVPPAGQQQILVELVRAEAAAILGHAHLDAVDLHRGFVNTGFTSLTGLELRNRLNAVTGLRLPSSMIYDYSTPASLADHLLSEMAPSNGDAASVLDAIQGLGSALGDRPMNGEVRAQVADQLRELLRTVESDDVPDQLDGKGIDRSVLEAASDDEMFALIDKELGRD